MIDYYTAYLHRIQEDDKQTLGAFVAYCGTEMIFNCKTLELPWRSNQPFISRIPSGVYTVVRRHSETYGSHWHVKDVYKRSLILLHGGNFHRDTEGCCILGKDHVDIDNDGYLDVTSSRQTMRALNNAIPVNQFRLMVI